MQVKVKDLVDQYCISRRESEKLYKILHKEIGKGNKVEVDFTGVKCCAAPFLNGAIGALLKDYPLEKINSQITIIATREIMQILNQVIENSNRYYSSPAYRKAVDKVISEVAKEE